MSVAQLWRLRVLQPWHVRDLHELQATALCLPMPHSRRPKVAQVMSVAHVWCNQALTCARMTRAAVYGPVPAIATRKMSLGGAPNPWHVRQLHELH